MANQGHNVLCFSVFPGVAEHSARKINKYEIKKKKNNNNKKQLDLNPAADLELGRNDGAEIKTLMRMMHYGVTGDTQEA